MLNMPQNVRTRIEALQDEARAAGNDFREWLCRQALAGNHTAWMLCVQVVLDAEAKAQEKTYGAL